MHGPFFILLYQVVKYSPLGYFCIGMYMYHLDISSLFTMMFLQAWTGWNSITSTVPSFRLPSRKWGPFRQEYYSICSTHLHHDVHCTACQTGTWRNVWVGVVENFMFQRYPDVWRWWKIKVFTIGLKLGRKKK